MRKEEEKIKSLGQVFTPSEIAEFIVNWCVRNSSDKVLDPCAGDGIFIQAAIRRFSELKNYETKENIYSIEKDWQLFLKLKQTFSDKATIIIGDFFDTIPSNRVGYSKNVILPFFTAIVGNPPYVERQRIKNIGKLRRIYPDVPPLSDLYVYFIIHSTNFLKDGGRLGFIISDTWLNMNFGKYLQSFLLTNYKIAAIIYFDERIFPRLVRAVIILAEKVPRHHKEEHDVLFVRVKSYSPTILKQILNFLTGNGESKDVASVIVSKISTATLKKENSWLPYVYGLKFYQFVKEHPILVPLKKLARTSIGLFTLANNFFILNEEKISKYKIEREFLKFILLSYKDVNEPIIKSDTKYYVLYCDKEKQELVGKNVLSYILWGENQPVKIRGKTLTVKGYHNVPRIKMSHRRPWYNLKDEIDERCIKPIAFPRRIYSKFIVAWNKTGAVLSDNFIGIEPINPAHLFPLLAVLNSSLTEYFARVRGHLYGGGVLDLRPKDVAELLTIDLNKLQHDELKKLENAFSEFLKNGDRELIDDIIFSILGCPKDGLRQELEDLKRLQLSI